MGVTAGGDRFHGYADCQRVRAAIAHERDAVAELLTGDAGRVVQLELQRIRPPATGEQVDRALPEVRARRVGVRADRDDRRPAVRRRSDAETEFVAPIAVGRIRCDESGLLGVGTAAARVDVRLAQVECADHDGRRPATDRDRHRLAEMVLTSPVAGDQTRLLRVPAAAAGVDVDRPLIVLCADPLPGRADDDCGHAVRRGDGGADAEEGGGIPRRRLRREGGLGDERVDCHRPLRAASIHRDADRAVRRIEMGRERRAGGVHRRQVTVTQTADHKRGIGLCRSRVRDRKREGEPRRTGGRGIEGEALFHAIRPVDVPLGQPIAPVLDA